MPVVWITEPVTDSQFQYYLIQFFPQTGTYWTFWAQQYISHLRQYELISSFVEDEEDGSTDSGSDDGNTDKGECYKNPDDLFEAMKELPQSSNLYFFHQKQKPEKWENSRFGDFPESTGVYIIGTMFPSGKYQHLK